MLAVAAAHAVISQGLQATLDSALGVDPADDEPDEEYGERYQK